MQHSEQKCAHFCSECCIMGYGTGAFWDLWDWSIHWRSYASPSLNELTPQNILWHLWAILNNVLIKVTLAHWYPKIKYIMIYWRFKEQTYIMICWWSYVIIYWWFDEESEIITTFKRTHLCISWCFIPSISDPFVKLHLCHGTKVLKTRKTSTKKNTIDPVFNESLSFNLTIEQLEACSLVVTVWDYNSKSKDDFVGRIVLGKQATGPYEVTHWNRMLQCQRSPVAQWHTMRAREECDQISAVSAAVSWREASPWVARKQRSTSVSSSKSSQRSLGTPRSDISSDGASQ